MKHSLLTIMAFFLCTQAVHANSSYLKRFNAYLSWSETLPTTIYPAFFTFIMPQTPLAQKLREQWLYEQARLENWSLYRAHYQPSHDPSLVCYYQFARLASSNPGDAISTSRQLWLNGDSLPPACDKLFTHLIHDHQIDEALIIQRLKLALKQSNLPLALYLFKKINQPLHLSDALLQHIHSNPLLIRQLTPLEPLHSDLYLYGLKQLVKRQHKDAFVLWEHAVQKHLLNEQQQQDFISQVALHKAAHNQPDCANWFARIKPQYITNNVLEWKIRLALKNKQWQRVIDLIKTSSDEKTPWAIYWTARAEAALGHLDQSRAYYTQLAEGRHYYGFLASLQLKKHIRLNHDKPKHDAVKLSDYRTILDKINHLYTTHQSNQASKLINDFASELPADEKTEFVQWVGLTLHWHAKAVYLSQDPDLANQLDLRFPRPYRAIVHQDAVHYNIPEALIYALMRQESAFRNDAQSASGAQGLMQLMPATARWIAKLSHIPYTQKNQLLLADKNIHLGVAYLHELNKHFHHPVLIMAAYNAGPKQVRGWLQSQAFEDMDIWVETIPYYETRNYIKNIIASDIIYQHILQQTPSLDTFSQTPTGGA